MAKYKFKGYTISCCGYHQPDHCVWWEAVDDRGCACFHGTTLREVEFMILDSEWEDKLKAKDREITAKDDVRLTIVAAYENVIADKDREIAELKDCILKEIDRLKRMIRDDLEGWATSMWSPSDEFRKHTFSRLIEDNTYHIERMKKALKGSNNATK